MFRFDEDYLKYKIRYCIDLLEMADNSEYTSKLFSNLLELLVSCQADLKDLTDK